MQQVALIEKDEDVEVFQGNHCYSWKVDNHSDTRKEGVCFLGNDLSGAASVRKQIEKKCEELNLTKKAAFEITLISDELVSNAIMATHEFGSRENIIFRWRFEDDQFCFCVIDHGGGLDVEAVLKRIPCSTSSFSAFIDDLNNYRKGTSVKINNHGKEVVHKRFGRGLKIVNGLVSKLSVGYHDKNGNTVDKLSNDIAGSIISAEYNIAS